MLWLDACCRVSTLSAEPSRDSNCNVYWIESGLTNRIKNRIMLVCIISRVQRWHTAALVLNTTRSAVMWESNDQSLNRKFPESSIDDVQGGSGFKELTTSFNPGIFLISIILNDTCILISSWVYVQNSIRGNKVISSSNKPTVVALYWSSDTSEMRGSITRNCLVMSVLSITWIFRYK